MKQNKTLNFFDLVIIAISFVIGMGIFKTPASIAAKSGTETIFYSAWLVGGLIAIIGAFIFAEIGARMPVTGAYYKIFSFAYHPLVGFTINSLVLFSNAASLAVVTLIGAEYCSDLLFGTQIGFKFNILVSLLSVLIFYGVNMLGLKTSSRTQNLLMILKIALVLILISAIFSGKTVAPHGHTDEPIRVYDGSNGWLLLIVSMVAVSFTYGGYQQTINFGAEVKAANLLPKAITVGLIIVIALYLAVNYAYVKVIGFEPMKNATSIGALLFEAWFGKWGAKFFDLAMFVSVLAYVNILLMGNPRVMYAMAQDGVLPKIFGYQHPRTQALIPGLTVFSAITILSAFFGKKVDTILGFSIFLDSLGFITCAIALLILRKRHINDQLVTGRVTHWMPILCSVFVLAYIIVAIAVVLDDYKAALSATGLLALMTLIYFLFIRKNRRSKET